MAAELERSTIIEHDGMMGRFREQMVEGFLRPHLPEVYGLATGQAFSGSGKTSNQLDVIVYDRIFSGAVMFGTGFGLFPCESVFGAIEVKSTLEGKELKQSIENIKSLKALNRAPSTAFDILPYNDFSFGQRLAVHDQPRRNPYVGVVFSYASMKPKTIVNRLNQMVHIEGYKELLPDLICCFKEQHIIARSTIIGTEIEIKAPGQDYDLFLDFGLKEDTLPIFFLWLSTILSGIRLKGVDHTSILNSRMKELLANSQERTAQKRKAKRSLTAR